MKEQLVFDLFFMEKTRDVGEVKEMCYDCEVPCIEYYSSCCGSGEGFTLT